MVTPFVDLLLISDALTGLIGTIIGAIIGSLFGAGGVYAWLKVGPERRKLIADAEKVIVDTAHSVLQDVRDDYSRLSDEIAQVKLENISHEKKHEDCQKEVRDLQATVKILQQDLHRHGRLSTIARRKAHLAIHSIGGYEILIEQIFEQMREHSIPITSNLRPIVLRLAFQKEMQSLENLEAEIINETVKQENAAI